MRKPLSLFSSHHFYFYIHELFKISIGRIFVTVYTRFSVSISTRKVVIKMVAIKLLLTLQLVTSLSITCTHETFRLKTGRLKGDEKRY